jgi:hypothetical protein
MLNVSYFKNLVFVNANNDWRNQWVCLAVDFNWENNICSSILFNIPLFISLSEMEVHSASCSKVYKREENLEVHTMLKSTS